MGKCLHREVNDGALEPLNCRFKDMIYVQIGGEPPPNPLLKRGEHLQF